MEDCSSSYGSVGAVAHEAGLLQSNGQVFKLSVVRETKRLTRFASGELPVRREGTTSDCSLNDSQFQSETGLPLLEQREKGRYRRFDKLGTRT
jgi:hypothetical protein